MAESNSKGGTPVFASPECFEAKTKKSDTFSFGRVLLFLLLSKEQFMKWLFVPIRNPFTSSHEDIITLITWMTSMTDRIDLQSARIIFNELRIDSSVRPAQSLINSFDMIANANLNDLGDYISELSEFR